MNRFEFYGNIEAYKRHRDELKHYGTIGQKWGIRKWQNPDGTFNEAGKERYFGSGKSNKEKTKEPKEQKMGSMLSFSRKVKKDFNKGIMANHERKKMVDDILKNRKDYDAVNLSDDEIRELVKKIEFPGGQDHDWAHDAQQQFKRESLKYQLEKTLNTKLGSISKPKIKAKYLNEDGTLNEEGKARVHAKANASATASAVFKILKWLKIAGMPITAISGISLAAMGAPATLVVAALAGLGIQGLGATGNHVIAKKLENRSSNYYKMLNGGNTNE